MIIIGQNKDVIINFELIRGIYIEDLDPEYMQPDKFRIVADSGNAIFPLGRYTKLSNAREVLVDIARQIANNIEDKDFYNNFYEMPIDSEVK